MARHILVLSMQDLAERILDDVTTSLESKFRGSAAGFHGAGIALVNDKLVAYSDVITLDNSMTLKGVRASLAADQKKIVGIVDDKKPWLVLIVSGQHVHGMNAHITEALALREKTHREAIQEIKNMLRGFSSLTNKT